MAVGLPAKTTYVDGDVFSASDINDTNGTINLIGQTTNFYAGKNKIINGDFGIWQRGTTFNAITSGSYFADRFGIIFDGTGTRNITRQSFTTGAAPVSGYESQYFLRVDQTVAGTGATFNAMYQLIENVQTYAGQIVNLSFWAKASSSITLPKIEVNQSFGSGGSGPVQTSFITSQAITTSWSRYTMSVAVPSIAGKTVGTSSSLGVRFFLPINSAFTFDIWGVQLEAGSVATVFQTATGTLQGELAACQRYYYRATPETTQGTYGIGTARSTTAGDVFIPFPVSMRVVPTVLDFANLAYQSGSLAAPRLTASGLVYNANNTTNNNALINGTVSSGFTSNQVIYLLNNNNSAGYIGFGAEL